MALEIEVCVQQACDAIRVVDTTGDYNAVTNVSGYNTPNPAFGDVTPFTVTFTPPGSTASIYTLNLLADPPAPDSNGYRTWDVSPADLGLDVITNGVWTIVWSAGDDGDVIGGTPQGNTLYVMMYGELREDVDELVLTAMQGCDDRAREKAFLLNDLLCGAVHMAGCGDRTKAQTMIEYIQGQVAACC